MIKRWLIFLAALLGCILFSVFYDGWLAWVLLAALLGLPVLSALVSLPAALTARLPWQPPRILQQEQQELFTAAPHSPLPLFPCRFRLQLTHNFTGDSHTLSSGDPLPTERCGVLECRAAAWKLPDYLGLVPLRIWKFPPHRIIIRPRPIPVTLGETQQRSLALAWIPKNGGGFSEQHELRLYRPGDNLNQIHWKLTAKTGKYIVREPMIPRPGKRVVTLCLWGSAQTLDRKLGQLLWLGRHMLESGHRFEIHAVTGSGTTVCPVSDERQLLRGLDSLLCAPTASAETIPELPAGTSFHYHIGGDENEA